MSKRIGIIGGVGPASTIEFYSRIIKKYHERFNDLNYPEMVIYSLSHGCFKEFEDQREVSKYKEYIMQGIKALIRANAEFIAFAAISPHRAAENVRNEINIPIISAVDSVVNHVKKIGIRKALLLGIKFTMQSDFFQKRFAHDNIELITPRLEHQDVIQNIIHDELVKSIVKDESRDKIISIVREYNVDTVILGCYRLPVLLKDKQNTINFIDSIDLHTSDVLNYAIR